MSDRTSPPTANVWTVLESDGHVLPMKSVTAEELAAIQANEQQAMSLAAPLWTDRDFDRANVARGAKVVVHGVLAPLFYSGSVGRMPACA